MDKTNLSNTTIMGSALVLLGVVLVIYDLSGIYKFLMTRKWITITGTVSSAETVGVLHRLITFTYSVHSGRKKVRKPYLETVGRMDCEAAVLLPSGLMVIIRIQR